jgi:hypothetical protein
MVGCGFGRLHGGSFSEVDAGLDGLEQMVSANDGVSYPAIT